MNEAHEKENEQRFAGLTTAALADAGERTALKTELAVRPPETELQPKARAGGASTLGDNSLAPAGAAATVATDERATPLFSPDETKEFRVRWDTIQGGFVDEPRRAVEQVDSLVAGAMQRLAEIFAHERGRLEGQWDRKESGLRISGLRCAAIGRFSAVFFRSRRGRLNQGSFCRHYRRAVGHIESKGGPTMRPIAIGLMLAVCVLAQGQRAVSDRARARIEREVRHELVMLPYYGLFDNLTFRVDGTTVTLLGQVTRPRLKEEAGRVLKDIEGVEKIENQIEVLPISPNDDRIRLATYRAVYGQAVLNRYALQAVPSIHIIVKNGNVTLEGVVDSQNDKNIAGLQANGVSGVFSVTNNLRLENHS